MNLNFILITTIFHIKEKKDEKVRVVKAHIGSTILTYIVQDSQKNIQPALTQIQSLTVTG